jgi:hypothetical protein
MIGEMIAEGQIPSLKEPVGLILPRKLSATARPLNICKRLAEAGWRLLGKSRLFFEFKAVAQSGCLVLEAYSVSHGKASAYLPVIDLLRNYFRIASEDDERTRREKVTARGRGECQGAGRLPLRVEEWRNVGRGRFHPDLTRPEARWQPR